MGFGSQMVLIFQNKGPQVYIKSSRRTWGLLKYQDHLKPKVLFHFSWLDTGVNAVSVVRISEKVFVAWNTNKIFSFWMLCLSLWLQKTWIMIYFHLGRSASAYGNRRLGLWCMMSLATSDGHFYADLKCLYMLWWKNTIGPCGCREGKRLATPRGIP